MTGQEPSQGFCPLPGCDGVCCVHLDKKITQLQADYNSSQQTVKTLEARVEQHRERHEHWAAQCAIANAERDESQQTVQELREQLAQAQKDTDRLDWLWDNWGRIIENDGDMRPFDANRTDDEDEEIGPFSIREAIDAARSASAPENCEASNAPSPAGQPTSEIQHAALRGEPAKNVQGPDNATR